MRARELSPVLVSAVLWCAGGCYSTSVVGTSVDSPEKQEKPRAARPGAQPTASSLPRTPSTIAAKPGELVGLSNPFLGDVDGDGFDDFLVSALIAGESVRADEETRAYLYYGRPDFPSKLSTAEADAVFQTNGFESGPLGDVDGDGLDDFVLSRFGSAEIVLGSAERLHGTYMPFTAGSRWDQMLPSLFDPGAAQMQMRGLGDLDGDGFDDLAINGAELLSEDDAVKISAPFGLSIQSYLVRGHSGAWPSATWDKSQADAKFGHEFVQADPREAASAYAQALAPFAAGDLDGDGHDDAVALGAHGLFVFYGGREYRGTIEPENADAYVILGAVIVAVIGDADGDGASDLIALSRDGKIGVHYGRRWSGEVKSQPDLELRIAGATPSELSAAAGDIDGDGLPEIVLATPPSTVSFDNPIPSPLDGSVFVLRGTGKRATGKRELGERDVLVFGPKPGMPLRIDGDYGFGLRLSMSGDVDGDGGKDILTSSMLTSQNEMAPTSTVQLIPSTPRTPD